MIALQIPSQQQLRCAVILAAMVLVLSTYLNLQTKNWLDTFGMSVLKEKKSPVQGGMIREGNGFGALGHGMIYQIKHRAASWNSKGKLRMAMQVYKAQGLLVQIHGWNRRRSSQRAGSLGFGRSWNRLGR